MFLFFIFCIALVSCRPSVFSPYHGFKELRPSSQQASHGIENNVHRHEFNHVDDNNRHIKFQYQAELNENQRVIRLDEDVSVADVKCSGKVLKITFKDGVQDASEFRLGSIVTGGPEWGCVDTEGKTSIILRRITKVMREARHLNAIWVETEHTSYHEIFKHLDVTFDTNKYPSNHFTETHVDAATVHATTTKDTPVLKRGWFSSITSFISKVWGTTLALADTVKKSIANAYEVTKAIVEGDYNGTMTKRWSLINYNYNPATGKASAPIVDSTGAVYCGNCYATVDASVSMSLSIVSHKVKLFRVTAAGQAIFHIDGAIKINQRQEISWSKEVAHITGAPMVVAIAGIPIVIHAVIPVNFGVDAFVDIEVVLSMKSISEASLLYGVQYTDAKGVEWIYENAFHKNGTVVKVDEGTISAGVMLYINPVIIMQIEYIGGPNFGLRPFMEVSLADKVENGLCADIQLSLNWGFQLTVGMSLHVSFANYVLLDKSTDPISVYSAKWTLASKCFAPIKRRAIGDGIQNATFIPGTTWSGLESLKRAGCGQTGGLDVMRVNVTYQLLNYSPEKNFGWFIGSAVTTLFSPEQARHAKCLSQRVFEAKTSIRYTTHGDERIIAFTVSDRRPDLDRVVMNQCDNPDFGYLFEGGEYLVSPDWKFFTDSQPSDCYTVRLKRGGEL